MAKTTPRRQKRVFLAQYLTGWARVAYLRVCREDQGGMPSSTAPRSPHSTSGDTMRLNSTDGNLRAAHPFLTCSIPNY